MPVYDYKAKRSPTETVEGQIHAVSEEEAVHKLSEQGLVPVHVEAGQPGLQGLSPARPAARKRQEAREGASGAGLKDSTRLKTSEVDKFTRQLATLVRTSVPILRALSLIADQPASDNTKAVIRDLSEQVSRGRPLSEAMRKYPRTFDNLYLSMVYAGESGGALDVTLGRLADHREKEQEMRRRIQAALAYPAFVVGAGAVTVFAVLTFFLPRVVDLFRNLQQELPWPTRVLIGTTDFMSAHWPWIVIAVVLLAAIVSRNRPGSKKKMLTDLFKLSVPGVKALILNSEIAKFARTLGMLISNGISIHKSLDLATGTIQNDVLRGKIEHVSDEIVSKGSTLSSSLSKTGVMPDFAVNMVIVGEESGELESALDEVANVYEREVEQAVKLMMALLEPVLILLVGGVVAFIVFAMLLPIFDIGGF